MALDTLIQKVHRLLGKRPKTAARLAEQLGYGSGRAVSRALAALVASGEAVKVAGRPAGYTKA